MPYEFVDELTVADIAFRAWGHDVEETFVAAADAVMNAMVEEPRGHSATGHTSY